MAQTYDTNRPAWVVTGANRGLGLEFARQLDARGVPVIGTARDPDAAAALRALGVRVEALDVADDRSVAAFASRLEGTRIDALINNAGRQNRAGALADLDFPDVLATFSTNALGPLRVTRALLPHLRAGDARLVVHVTSRMGCFGEYDGPSMYAYRASKAALDMLHLCVADELGPEGFRCVALHPGWVRTDMGGPAADLSVEESVRDMLAVIDGLDAGANGALLDHTGRPLPW